MQDTSRHTASDLQLLPTCGAHAAMLLLCLVGSSFEDESVFGLFWIEVLADAKGICPSLCISLCLHIHKVKKHLLPALQKNGNPPACGHITPDPPAPP